MQLDCGATGNLENKWLDRVSTKMLGPYGELVYQLLLMPTVSHCGEGGEDVVEAHQLHTTTVSTRDACWK